MCQSRPVPVLIKECAAYEVPLVRSASLCRGCCHGRPPSDRLRRPGQRVFLPVLSAIPALPLFRQCFRQQRQFQQHARELQQTGRLSHKRPNGEDYTSLLPGSNLPGFVSKELYASGQATPAEFVSHLKTRRSGVDWETVLDTQYTQIGIGYAVDADGVPYWELLLLNG